MKKSGFLYVDFYIFAGVLVATAILAFLYPRGGGIAAAIIVSTLLNTVTGWMLLAAHRKAGTELREQPPFEMFLKRFAGLLEIFVFTFLLVFREITLLAGWLILKAVGERWIDQLRKDGKHESAAVALFRIGVISQFAIALIATIILINSGFVQDRPQSVFYYVQEFFEAGK